eukprot:769329-Prorocentrum_minimum.AAC.1
MGSDSYLYFPPVVANVTSRLCVGLTDILLSSVYSAAAKALLEGAGRRGRGATIAFFEIYGGRCFDLLAGMCVPDCTVRTLRVGCYDASRVDCQGYAVDILSGSLRGAQTAPITEGEREYTLSGHQS